MRSFIDTNIAVYAHDHGDPEKRRHATDLLRERAAELVVSPQVLSEFYWVVTRRLRPALSHLDAAAATRFLAQLPVVPIDAVLVLGAIDTAKSCQLAYWDALIVEAAATGGCERLYTEDLGHGARIRGVEVVNPFR